jgi:hypothetical protein
VPTVVNSLTFGSSTRIALIFASNAAIAASTGPNRRLIHDWRGCCGGGQSSGRSGTWGGGTDACGGGGACTDPDHH